MKTGRKKKSVIIKEDFTTEQFKAVELRNFDILVSAGAGTGKTRVLVSRFIDLVDKGDAGIDEILAVTFTEKAAEEMKGRIIKAFEKAERPDLKYQAENAWIGTVHGFCTRILKENPFAAGLDPDFEVLSEADKAFLIQEAFTHILNNPIEEYFELLETFKTIPIERAIVDYIELNRSLGHTIDRFETFIKNPEIITTVLKEKLEEITVQFQKEIIQLSDSVKSRNSNEQKVEQLRTDLTTIVEGFHDGVSDNNRIDEIKNLFYRKKPEKFSDDYNAPIANALTKIKKLVDDWAKKFPFSGIEYSDDDIKEYIISFIRGARDFWQYLEKLKQGRLDYEDLQLKTLELFRKKNEVKEEYRSRFKHILVDEFQDINNLQREILEEIKPDKGFFIVGDIRQSIFGFRNTDVTIMRSYHESFSKGQGKVVDLKKNFRSGSNILNFVNYIFSKLWEGKIEAQPLSHARKEFIKDSDAPPVEIIIYYSDKGHNPELLTDDLRELEAGMVAQRINQLVKTGVEINDAENKFRRPLRYSDIAILFRSRSSYDYYQNALKKQGIPYTVQRNISLFDQREITDAIAFLSILENCRNDINVAAVLRSTFFGFSDDGLLILAEYAGANKIKAPYLIKTIRKIIEENNYLNSEDKKKAIEFITIFDELRKIRHITPPDKIFDLILEKTMYEAKMLTTWGGERKIINLNKLRDYVSSYTAKEGINLARFLDFFNNIKEWSLADSETEQEPEHGDKVTLTTMHSAKGLEYPVVIIGDMGRGKNPNPNIPVHQDLHAGLKLSEEDDGKKPRYLRSELISHEKKIKEEAEEERLLYVAMTRARDMLILAGSKKTNKVTPLIKVIKSLNIEDSLESGIREIKNTIIKLTVNADAETTRTGLSYHPPFIKKFRDRISNGQIIKPEDIQCYDPDISAGIEKKIDFLKKVLSIRTTTIPERVSVSGLLLYNECPMRFFLEQVLKVPEPDMKTMFSGEQEDFRSGARIGDVFHKYIEYVNYSGNPEDETERLMKILNPLDIDIRKISELIKNFLMSDIAKEIRESDIIKREVPLSLYINNTSIHGRIDIAYKSNEGKYRIIDFKTGKKPDKHFEELYKFQLEIYGLMLSRAMNSMPADGRAYFLMHDYIITSDYNGDMLNNCMNRVEIILKDIGKGCFNPRRNSRCKTCSYNDSYCVNLSGISE